MEKGIEIGETKALTNTAMLQLTHKFGELPDEIKNAISHASKETSQNILLNIFSIESIDDIRHYFNKY